LRLYILLVYSLGLLVKDFYRLSENRMGVFLNFNNRPMKKTIFRSLIVGLFAVVSTSAFTQNYSLWPYPQF